MKGRGRFPWGDKGPMGVVSIHPPILDYPGVLSPLAEVLKTQHADTIRKDDLVTSS